MFFKFQYSPFRDIFIYSQKSEYYDNNYNNKFSKKYKLRRTFKVNLNSIVSCHVDDRNRKVVVHGSKKRQFQKEKKR